MGKSELGLKCTCVSCAVRFFDLCRVPAVCPKCGAEQPKPKPRFFAPSRSAARSWSSQTPHSPAAAPAEAEDAADDDVNVLDDTDADEPDATEAKDEDGVPRDRDD